jgi:hypothetical protein
MKSVLVKDTLHHRAAVADLKRAVQNGDITINLDDHVATFEEVSEFTYQDWLKILGRIAETHKPKPQPVNRPVTMNRAQRRLQAAKERKLITNDEINYGRKR